MPTKKQKNHSNNEKAQPRGHTNHHGNIDEATLSALVEAIEGGSNKKGMTKSQVKTLEEKRVQAIERIYASKLDEIAIHPHHFHNAVLAQRFQQQCSIQAAAYVNVPIPLKPAQQRWQKVAPDRYVRYESFDITDSSKSDATMNFIVDLFTAELSEPYSSFTYQYFVFGWPDLCLTAYGVQSSTPPEDSVKGEKVGTIVSRVVREGPGEPLSGYVAMFAVLPKFRGFRLGRRLIELTVELMRAKGCDEVYLETPITNERAYLLYTSLGFVKTAFLPRYYLDYSDAVRLKLWLKDAFPNEREDSSEAAAAPTKGDAVEEQSAA
ncbi:unnamed protein product [Phytomonas sp. Hart1]|nr:unnamed protein product [Phytomonas sp. Hart1]|eukprot:CCW72113.1 unnamed protein product [Phytomonas sp. isolate Hart1]